MQTVEPWMPPDVGVDAATVAAILKEIDAGPGDGVRYSDHGSAKDRIVWPVVTQHAPNMSEKACRELVAKWLKPGGFLKRSKYKSPQKGDPENGLFVVRWPVPEAPNATAAE